MTVLQETRVECAAGALPLRLDELYGEARRDRPPMSVRCAETGEVFPSVLAASRALGLSESERTHVYRAAANPERTSGGFHWEVAGARALAV